MAMLINIPGRPLDKLISKLSEYINPDELYVWPNVTDKNAVNFALVWKHQAGSLTDFPSLQGISSFGAGVDSIISDSQLPDVPLARIVDPDLANNMANFVYTMIQHHKLRLPQFSQQQSDAIWKPKSPRRNKHVGILGLGQLGQATAKLLVQQGFTVSGWSVSEKHLANVTSYKGEEGLTTLLTQSDYLVCLLPLTEHTTHILNQDNLSQLPKGAVVINVARGEHLDDDALITLLNNGHIDAAYLDVFKQEPLPKDHVFWQQKGVFITPHVSAVTNVETAVSQIVENYQRVNSKKQMINCIDRKSGY